MPFSGNYRIDALLYNAGGEPARWAGPTGVSTIVTYAFADSPGEVTVYNTNPYDWSPLTAAQRNAERQALHAWADVSGIILVELPDYLWKLADIDIHMAAIGSANVAAYAYYPGNSSLSGRLVLDKGLYGNSGFQPGSYEYMVMLHETGHALGFKHPFDPGVQLPQGEMTVHNTVMAYDTSPGVKPARLGSYDIAAAQHLYGGWDAGYSELHAAPVAGGGFNITGIGWTKYLPAEVVSVSLFDGDMVLSDSAPWFQVQRLYEIVFNREGAGSEVAYWTNTMRAGYSLKYVADMFAKETVGWSDHEMVTAIYTNLLSRAPDAEGYANAMYYLQQTHDRGGLFVSASESPEAYSLKSGHVDGLSVFNPKPGAGTLAHLWESLYGDSPFPKEAFNFWLDAMQRGYKSLGTVAQEMVNSGHLPYISDADYMQTLYHNALNRDAAPTEINYWLSAMYSSGQGRGWIAQQISQDATVQALNEDLYHHGIIYA